MMKTSLSKHEKMMASKSWRMANASNSREEQNLQKEKQRLMKQYEAETCQLKAAQNRFENQYRKKKYNRKEDIACVTTSAGEEQSSSQGARR